MNTEEILILDMGNSRVKWAIFSVVLREYIKQGVIENDSVLENKLESSFIKLEPMRIWMAKVGKDELALRIEDWFAAKWNVRLSQVETRAFEFGVVNGYSKPEKLGVDRWMAIIAGWQLNKSAFCVIDCGTAITIDCVSEDGCHLGGIIMPGIITMKKALTQNTSIDVVEMTDFMSLAQNTVDAVSSGVWNAVRGGIMMVLAEFRKIVPEYKILLCGGDADSLASCLGERVEIKESLVMDGICMVAIANDA